MFEKFMFALSLKPGEYPVLFTDPKQIQYEDTGWEAAMSDFYKHEFLDGALFELVTDPKGKWELWCDDEGHNKGLEMNQFATGLYRSSYSQDVWDQIGIVGPAIAFFREDPRELFPDLLPWNVIDVREHGMVPTTEEASVS